MEKDGTEVGNFAYVNLGNGKAFTCSKYLTEEKSDTNMNAEDYPGAEELSIIGSTISVISCLLTFVTYYLFPSLRNIPGKIVMNLCVALAVAEFIMPFGPLVSNRQLPCKIWS